PQREAVLTTEGPVLVLAGAGTGKTAALTARLAHLIATRKAWPSQILAVTFTNKAARQLRERVGELVEHTDGMWVGTFHSVCVRMLRRDAEQIGISANFTIFDEDDRRAALKRVLTELELDPKRNPPALLASLISKAKNELLTPETYPNHGYRDEVVRRCFSAYQRLLERCQGLDFDDLLSRAVALLRDDEEARQRWQERFRYVLVDEYQDTNRAQYMLVNLLAKNHRQLAVVGDDDQSIYAWRGADVRNILNFEQDYPEAKVIRLEQNYRSTQPILDAAYQVIRKNPERAEKRLWTDRSGGELIQAVQLYNEVEEAEFVADEIQRLVKAEGSKYKDAAVLYRTNAQSRAFEDVFARRQIPYCLVGGVRFWERAEVKDLVAYLRLLMNPDDAVSFTRVVNVPRRKLGEVSVTALLHSSAERELGLNDVLADGAAVKGLPSPAVAAVRRFYEQLESVRATIGVLPPSELVAQLIETVGLDAHYGDGTPQGDARVQNLTEVQGLAAEFDDQGSPTEALQLFLNDVALVSDVDGYKESGEGVTLITLHAVKGLEFPAVFLSGLEEGVLPHRRAVGEVGSSSGDDPIQLAEERRLCYVGMTRAQDRLYLSCVFRRHLYGQAQASRPSRFLGDLPANLLSSPARGGAPV
ncbi:MAG: ATP-dependent helicase, partial [Candidatus Dormibacteraceae bacterium]